MWRVPRYQRGYKWTEKQVKELLADIDSAIQEKQPEYFLGSVVVATGQDGYPEIVDGQQRLATVSIIIAAIRDILFSEQKDLEAADLLQGQYLLRKDWKTKEPEPRLTLSTYDQDFFLKKILEAPSVARNKIKPTKDSHKRLVAAYQEIRDHLSEKIKGLNKPVLALQERVEYLSDKTLVILVEVPTHQNAFTIFETLNDRGLDLAISDLLKNFCFHLAGNRIDEVQQKWTEMIVTIETSVNEESIKEYLRHQWSSTHGLTRERELFERIKENVTTKTSVVAYVEELRVEASLFAAIHNGSHDTWKGYSTEDKQYISIITDVLGLEKRISPLLLAIMAKLPKKQVSGCLRMIVGWGVRILVAHSVAGQLERRYSEAAVKIRAGAIKTAKELYEFMKDVIPSDSDFEKAFSGATVTKATLARYYLRVLERQEDGETEPELVPNPNELEVNLEHVLPQNRLANTWTNFSAEDYESYRFRLGNLALMKGTPNSHSGADEFLAKRTAYANSLLKLTKQIAKESVWGKAQIETRQAKLAKQAILAWPTKPK
jgi:hypothetical protein